MEENKQDILTDIISPTELVQAGSGKRFANFLIDYVAFFVFIIFIEIIWLLVNPESLSRYANEINDSPLWFNLAILLLYIIFHSTVEFVTKGRSMGKLLTGTKAVYEDGSNITVGTAVKRTLSRLVPFEPFSGLGTPCNPWHDNWTRTYVIDIKKSSVLTGEQYNNYNSTSSL